jgi:hypothetical protein
MKNDENVDSFQVLDTNDGSNSSQSTECLELKLID